MLYVSLASYHLTTLYNNVDNTATIARAAIVTTSLRLNVINIKFMPLGLESLKPNTKQPAIIPNIVKNEAAFFDFTKLNIIPSIRANAAKWSVTVTRYFNIFDPSHKNAEAQAIKPSLRKNFVRF